MDYSELSQFLDTLDASERRVVISKVSSWHSAKRRRRGGRAVVLKTCLKCNREMTAREMWVHKCTV